MTTVDEARVATRDQADVVTELTVGAFYELPTWSWPCPDPVLRRAQHRRFWRSYVDGRMRSPPVWLTANHAAGMLAYLEASNPANVPLYERYGFRVAGAFDLPDSGPRVHMMWRERASAS